MKRLVIGIVLGLTLAAAAGRAEWDYNDYGILKDIRNSFLNSVQALARLEKQQERLIAAEEWQARSLQRIVWVLERKWPAPPEKADAAPAR